MGISQRLPTDDEGVRRLLRSDLGKEIPEPLLRLLEAHGSLIEYRKNPTAENRSKLSAAAGTFLRRDPGRKKDQRTRVSLDQTALPEERRRAEVYARHLAHHASRQRSVLDLRRLLGGSVLTQAKAKDFWRQLGLRYFSPEWFEERGVPLLEHKSFYNGPEFGGDTPVAREQQMIRFAWDGKHLDVPGYADLKDFVAHEGLELQFASEQPIRVLGFSVLGHLQRVASELAAMYGWLEADATLFILTGIEPPLFAIGFRPVGTLRSYHVAFEFRIEPWASADSVRDTFWSVQKQLCDPMRRKDEKQIELFEHVESFLWKKYGRMFEELSPKELDNHWPEITELWNDAHGSKRGWRYDAKRLREAFLRVRPAIATPPCGPHRRRGKQTQ